MNYRHLDCYARFEDHHLTIGNQYIERCFFADSCSLTPLALTDKQSGFIWQREEGVRHLPLPFSATKLSASAAINDHHGLSDPFLQVELTWRNDQDGELTRTFSIFPQSPFITMELFAKNIGVYTADGSEHRAVSGNESAMGAQRAALPDCIDLIHLPRGQYKLHTALLADKTDVNDTLVRESIRQVYSGGWADEGDEGNFFIMDDYLHDSAFMIVKEAPANLSELNRRSRDLYCQQGVVAQLVGSGLHGEDTRGGIIGYGSTVGVGRREALLRAWRDHYRRVWKNAGGTRIMSNTWGDRNQDRAVCHEFMMNEIDRAAFLGADVVQIDDGWQHGHTANSALKKGGVWEGYYSTDPDFWQINREKFPQGLKPLVKKAKEHGLELGLWFSPDSTNDFALWRRDADTLLNLWNQEDIRHFKLDGVNIRSKQGERNYLRLLEALAKESDRRIQVYQDITAQVRLGSIYFRQYGRLFVENRYTDTAAYYPYRTLKNAWHMCRYVPLNRLQFEALNPRRNLHRYPPDDALRPDAHDMDYLFAAVLLSSPLLWMEMTHLNEADSLRLKELISVYRQHRNDFDQGDVSPVGEAPDGVSLTGFRVDCEDHGYLLLLRESTNRSRFSGMLPKGSRARLLHSNADVSIDDSRNEIVLSRPRSYALIEWRI